MKHLKRFNEANSSNKNYKIIYDELSSDEFDNFIDFYSENFENEFPEPPDCNWENLPDDIKNCFIEWVDDYNV